MSCVRGDNRMFCVALAVRHRLQWFVYMAQEGARHTFLLWDRMSRTEHGVFVCMCVSL